MRKTFWDKRIPTLLGLFIIIVGTVITTFYANKTQLGQVNALNSDQPQNVRITNITNNSFSVSYTTENKTSGSINYGKDKTLGQNALDDRDQTNGGLNQYLIHIITARDLTPSTKYYFTITNGNKVYTTNGADFEVTTSPSLTETSNPQITLNGQIINANGLPPTESIVYLAAENSQVFSTITDKNGRYSFSLSQLRTKDLQSNYNFNTSQTVKMLVTGEDGAVSNVILSIPEISNIPTIILSKDYDFTQSNSSLEASSSAQIQTLPSFPQITSTYSAQTLRISTPQKDENFSDQQPIFKGTATPNQNIQITIHSNQQIQANVKTDSSGNWSYQPQAPLSAGTHTITISTTNSSGIIQTITQTFVVQALADQSSITGSPTPTPTILDVNLTPTPTEIATISATPTQILPPTGNPSIIAVGIIGIVIFFMGSLLFLLTRGGI